jgi:hypothetical protein
MEVGPKTVCKTVLVYFGKMPKDLNVEPDVAVDAKGVSGIYVDLDVRGTKLDRMGYLKILKFDEKVLGALKCLTVKSNVPRTLIGAEVELKIKNSCNTWFSIVVKGDVENFADITITKTAVAPNSEKTVTVEIPKFVGVPITGFLGTGPAITLRGIYVNANGTEIYYVPTYDFFLYYIKPNAKAVWYQNGVEVKSVKAGSVVKGCVVTPDVVPTTKVPQLQGTLKVIEDLMFMPDKVVAKKEVVISQLPMKVCEEFVANKSWNTRGYKLQLEVKEDVKLFGNKVPLVASIAVYPELSVR